MDEVNGQDYHFIFRLQLKKTSSGFGFLCSTKNSLSKVAFNNYSSGPNNSVVLNKHGGWTIFAKSIKVWSGISVWSDFFLNLGATI